MNKKSNKKALFIIFGTLFLLSAAVIGGGWWFIKVKGPEYLREAKAIEEEARKTGANLTEPACVDRAVAVLKSPDGHGIGTSIRNMVSMTSCLEASKPVANFCDDMPEAGSIVNTALWQAKTCAEIGDDSDHCTHLVGEVVKYCYSSKRAAKVARAQEGMPVPGTPSSAAEKKAEDK